MSEHDFNSPTTPRAAEAVPSWFHNRVVSGLQFMWALGLPGTPASELATVTASAWVHALWHVKAWNEERDSYRLYAGFTALAARAERWPAPRMVLDNMPPPPTQPLLQPPRGVQPQHVRDYIARRTRRATDRPQETPQ